LSTKIRYFIVLVTLMHNIMLICNGNILYSNCNSNNNDLVFRGGLATEQNGAIIRRLNPSCRNHTWNRTKRISINQCILQEDNINHIATVYNTVRYIIIGNIMFKYVTWSVLYHTSIYDNNFNRYFCNIFKRVGHNILDVKRLSGYE